MNSVRLNSTHRDEILEKLIGDRFTQAEEICAEQERNLGFDVYKDMLGDEYDAIQNAPRHWFRHAHMISVSFGGEYTRLHLPDDYPFPNSRVGDGKSYPSTHVFAERWIHIERQRREVHDERRELIREIRSVLNSVTTSRKLCEVWPEISEIVNQVCDAPVGGVPMVQVGDLNSKLGLSG